MRRSLISLHATPSPRTLNLHRSIVEGTNMSPPPPDTRTPTAASAISLHPCLTLRDKLRFGLFFAITMYGRLCLSASVWSTFWHIYIVGSTGVCIVHFSGDYISLGQVGDIVYGLAISSFPIWSKSYRLTSWIVPEIEGWIGLLLYWAFMITKLNCLLPERYGSDIQVR
jgi:hypothetical protein